MLMLLSVFVPWVTFAEEFLAPTPMAARELLAGQGKRGLRLGMFDLYPHIGALVLFDDNIFSHSSVREPDLIWQALPGITFALGDFANPAERALVLEYSPGFVFFTEQDEFTTVDHFARFAGNWPFTKLTLSFVQDFSRQSSAVLGVADRVARQSFVTGLKSRYEFSEKTSFEINARQTLMAYEESGLVDSREWTAEHWLDYSVFPKLVVGAGAAAGFLAVEEGSDQIYERLSLRGVYTATGKLNLTASAGGEHRNYSGVDTANTSPVFSIGTEYRITPATTFAVNGSRGEQNSTLLSGQNYLSTGFTASVRRQLGECFLATLAGGFSRFDYHRTQEDLANTRSDKTFYLKPEFAWLMGANWRAGIFYCYRRNASNQTYYDYENNQVGLQTSYDF